MQAYLICDLFATKKTGSGSVNREVLKQLFRVRERGNVWHLRLAPRRAESTTALRRESGGAAGGGGATGAGGVAPQAGKALFISNGCDGCHTFKPAGAKGTVGPDLDDLRQAAQTAGQPLEQFIRQSIVDPNAYVAPGYQKGVMPGTFASLPPAQLDALVKYLEGSK
jgi:cytochrome c551/c552